MTAGPNEKDEVDEACRIVGELTLLTAMLDHRLNEVLIAVLDLGSSKLLLPTIATLDLPRKADILKSRARTMPKGLRWREELLKLAEGVEAVNRARNIACHSLLSVKEGRPPVLWSLQAAKVMRNLTNGTSVGLDRISDASRKAEELLSRCSIIIENYESANLVIRERLASTSREGKAG